MTDPQPFYETFDSIDAPPQAVRLPATVGPVLLWAKAKNPREMAGAVGIYEWCPVAAYLRSLGAPDPWVSGLDYTVDGGRDGALFDAPDWVDPAVESVDAIESRQYITFKTFVRILESIHS